MYYIIYSRRTQRYYSVYALTIIHLQMMYPLSLILRRANGTPVVFKDAGVAKRVEDRLNSSYCRVPTGLAFT